MSQLMPYLIINYPNPEIFQESLGAMFEASPNYLEIQLPFSNPVADGPIIYAADQVALKFNEPIEKSLEVIDSIKKQFPSCKTELILMSYISRAVNYGCREFAELLVKYNYYGLVCPDMPFGTPEQKLLSEIWKNQKPCLIPVISPLTKKTRLDKIKLDLKPNQMIYPMARVGKTGGNTDLNQPEILEYFNFLKTELPGYKIAIGFGIKSREQIEILDKYGFVAIVATELIRRINTALENEKAISTVIKNFVLELSGLPETLNSHSRG